MDGLISPWASPHLLGVANPHLYRGFKTGGADHVKMSKIFTT